MLFDKRTLTATDYLSDAPEEYLVGAPAGAGPHVIRQSKDCGTHKIIKYKKGSWPTTDRIVSEYRLLGAALPHPKTGKLYRCLLVGVNGSRYTVCDEDGRETHLGSFLTSADAEMRIEVELQNRARLEGVFGNDTK